MKKINFVPVLFATLLVSCKGGQKDTLTGDKYLVKIACQSESGETIVIDALAKAYMAKHPDVTIECSTFSGDDFENYMITKSAKQETFPNIVWTSDDTHCYWDQYFVDLRPYYESSPETDYSLYYETMLDTAGMNGKFKPTCNYTGEFRKDDKDTATGYEHYTNHSEYGLFYAPRDYNKPAIILNETLFGELDSAYESAYKTKLSLDNMPQEYKSCANIINEIISGSYKWESMDDFYGFTYLVADRLNYVTNFGSNQDSRRFKSKRAIYLNYNWEPVYTTFMNDLDLEIFDKNTGKFALNNPTAKAKLEEVHSRLFPTLLDQEGDPFVADFATDSSSNFAGGGSFMEIVSRPSVLGYSNTLAQSNYSINFLSLPVESIAAGNSGYGIINVWENQKQIVGGVEKKTVDLSWDFIKFIISKEGQELAGKTGLNVPVLKSLYDAESNDGQVPEWRKAISENLNHDAFVAGNELKQDTFSIYKSFTSSLNESRRLLFKNQISFFFLNYQKKNYGEGSISALLSKYESEIDKLHPENSLLK